MQINEEVDQPTTQMILLMFSLAHILDLCGWIQFGIARREKLEPIHIALLRRALRHKKVTFGGFQRETALSLYTISRAAKRLQDRGLAKLRSDPADRRRRWLRITKSGCECMSRIELAIAREALWHAGVISHDSKRYYNFTVHLWNTTRFFSPSQVTVPGVYFPSEIQRSEKIGAEQRNMQQFMADLQQDPVFSPTPPPWAEEPDTK